MPVTQRSPFAELPLPAHFDARRAGEVWRVPYEERAREARAWAAQHAVARATEDHTRIALVLVDVQNTFCAPGFELYVGGRSGTGAVDDTRRLAEFIYRNLPHITRIVPTMDTHQTVQIFHAAFLTDAAGEPPPPYTLVSVDDVQQGRWRINPDAAEALGLTPSYAQRHLQHYAEQLAASGKYALTVWPYHGMLGGIGHALASLVEEAVFFHGMARMSQPHFHVKGSNPLTEHYSVLGPEVLDGPDGRAIAEKDHAMVDELLSFDAVVIAGQAKSHCVAWTIADLLSGIEEQDRELARRVYLLEDCTTPVVIPGVVDYTEDADRAFRRFAEAGMHVVRASVAMADWPGLAR
ncbi:isochorismatase [Ectothiorhodospiraceae bacterium 2226]|nr:isochorismatase [Ectothiorhodospiraceae bacterium 2226]